MPDEPYPLNDEQLVQRCRDGDRDAFAVLVERHWRVLYGWLYRLTWSTHIAEDLTQESFCKAWTSLSTHRSEHGFRAWLFRIARNLWVDHCRREKLAATQMLSADIPSREIGPLEQLLGDERDVSLRLAIDGLPDDYREALLLRTEQALSFAEIGVILEVKEDTARWRVFKARQLVLNRMTATTSREELPS